jgi:RHH-type proline utilization regulon transcriptional repressor/proline dehydrogenase/delta 1-pyrroline-5-carboxylate dehydrogenase
LNEAARSADAPFAPFLKFAADLPPQTPLRAAITSATRRPEPECVAELLDAARLPAAMSAAVQRLAKALALKLRQRGGGSNRDGLVQALMREFALSTDEGVALMCIAEALLRIPDAATRDALIRDKLNNRDWQSHLNRSDSLFVNAATWGLFLTGTLAATHSERGLARALARAIVRHGEPLLRKAVELTMRLMAEQFVIGETMSEALEAARHREAQGFRYSFDMLGEAAITEDDAQRYCAAYSEAIHATGDTARS